MNRKIAKMKKKFLFPVFYLILLGISLLTFEGITLILLTPVNLIILALEVNFGLSQGTLTSQTCLYILGGSIQYFLIGSIYDAIVEYFKNKKYNGE